MGNPTKNVGYCFLEHNWTYWSDSHVCGSLSWQNKNRKNSFPGCREVFGDGTPDKLNSLVIKVNCMSFVLFSLL